MMHPIYISYVFFPLLMIVSRVGDFEVPRNIIDVYWVILLLASLPNLFNWLLYKKIPRLRLLLYFTIVFVLVVKFSLPWVLYDVSLVPYLMSVKPIFYFLVAIGTCIIFSSVDKHIFVKSGIALSLIIIFEFIISSIAHGTIVRPRGSGEINYDACLILLSIISARGFCFAHKKIVLSILFGGLFLTFSRTAILTLLILYLVFEKKQFFTMIIASTSAVIFFIGSYLIRGLSIDSLDRYDRLWMWLSAFDLLVHQPFGLVFGFLPGVSLTLDVPINIQGLWDYQAALWGLSGVFSYNYHSFWLRALIDYGLFPILIMFFLFVVSFFNSIVQKQAFFIFLALQGMTMGLFYLGNVSVVIYIYILTLYTNNFNFSQIK